MANTVLITGAASGIGRASAEYFSARGWNVAAASRRTPRLLSGPAILPLPLDITNEAAIASAVAATLGRFGNIDVLVNNAGYGLFGPLEGADSGELEAQFQTNLFGTAAMIRAVLPHMRERRRGTIVNLSSVGGRFGVPFGSAYIASKFAIEGLSESLRYELSLHGIRVKLVEPGQFRTGFIERGLHSTSHPAYDGSFANYMQWVERGDAAAPGPEPVAAAIFRAATDSSGRLRYPVKGSLLLALHSLLPDGLWRSFMAAAMSRKPRAAQPDAAPE
jgi:NAD(P)-dependent dehydrogenase (short-subunit alcohol dehydrogenase family)